MVGFACFGMSREIISLNTMVELSAEQLAQRAFDLNLLDERSLREVWGQLGSRNVNADELKQVLLRRELLTNYQVDRILRGERSGYFYGKYKVLYQVGSGSFARVYRAVHSENGEIVAVKVLRRRFNEDSDQRESFKQEAEVGLKLRHPNIVPIYEVSATRSASYMVMEFVEGRNLREFMKVRKKLSPEEATRIAIDIAAGLDYAFGRGISHRDLKMSNILISSTGVAKLLDFGLAGADANLSDEALASLANPRTIDYAALERATGVRKDDGRSDIYFLGCMYYQMLSGVPPLAETRDRIQRLSKSRFMEIVPIQTVCPDLPRPVVHVVTKAMKMDPNERYQTPGELLADLRRSQEPVGDDLAAKRAARRLANEGRTLMIVESGTAMQNLLRDQLKKSGFKVLVTSDARRPMTWFTDSEKPADCVVFSTANLGQQALESFNEFGQSPNSSTIPAILLLGPKHAAWRGMAQEAEHRRVLNTPIKLRQVRQLLSRLLNQAPPAEDESAEASAEEVSQESA